MGGYPYVEVVYHLLSTYATEETIPTIKKITARQANPGVFATI